MKSDGALRRGVEPSVEVSYSGMRHGRSFFQFFQSFRTDLISADDVNRSAMRRRQHCTGRAFCFVVAFFCASLIAPSVFDRALGYSSLFALLPAEGRGEFRAIQ